MKIDLNFMINIFNKSLNMGTFNLLLNSQYDKVPEWDSLGHMRIISAIELELGIEFDIDEIVDQDTVQKLINMTILKLKK